MGSTRGNRPPEAPPTNSNRKIGIRLAKEVPRYEPMTMEQILLDKSASPWLKDALRTAYERDSIDALHDARRLLKLLGERYAEIVRGDAANVGGRVHFERV
jgi:hypothetical protein